MGYMSTETRERLEDRLTVIEAQIDTANDTMDSLLSKINESYRFDSGEASQQAKRMNIEKLSDQIDILERRAQAIRNRLNGMGVLNLNVRRRG